jgi:hypothetical protein
LSYKEIERDLANHYGSRKDTATLPAILGAANLGNALRQLEPLHFLEVCLPNGDRYGLPYVHLIYAAFRADGGPCLDLGFVSHLVRIYGRNLQDALPLFVLHAVGSIELSEGPELLEGGVWLVGIEILANGRDSF